MILTCPSCRTRYQADSARFKAPGRNVRCAKCGQVWFESVPEAESETEPEPVINTATPPSSPAPIAAPASAAAIADRSALHMGAGPLPDVSVSAPAAERRRARGASFAQSLGWMILIFLIAGIGWATVEYRQTVASLWPQSASLYAALGLPVNARGIELTNIAYQREVEDGQPVLSVTGKVVNITKRELPVPEIRVMLLDDAQHELYHWTYDAGIPTLKPGAESSFVTRLSSPPAEARNLNVRFAEAGETR